MNINGMAALRNLLANMETDMGLHELSGPQRDILYAASLLSSEGGLVTAGALHQHPLVCGMTRSSFFRSLKSLCDAGYLTAMGGRSGSYEINKRL